MDIILKDFSIILFLSKFRKMFLGSAASRLDVALHGLMEFGCLVSVDILYHITRFHILFVQKFS